MLNHDWISALSEVSPGKFYEIFDKKLPVDVFKIADVIGLKVSDDFDFEKISRSGEIKWSEDRGVEVWINPVEVETRRRFTLAHEIGHFFLHMWPHREDDECESFVDGAREFRRSGEVGGIEYQANAFAADLLMPVDAVRAVVEEIYKENIENRISKEEFLRLMSNRFDVSSAAMEIRLKNIGVSM